MLNSIMKSMFGSSNDRYVKSLGKIVNQINALEPQLQALSDEELAAQTDKFRAQLADGKTLDDILPEAFATLRRLLEARMASAGRREYVQVLRLLETFRLEEVHAGVREALRLGVIGFDAAGHLVLCRIEKRPPRLNLVSYPYLPRARVKTTSAGAYMDLLTGVGS